MPPMKESRLQLALSFGSHGNLGKEGYIRDFKEQQRAYEGGQRAQCPSSKYLATKLVRTEIFQQRHCFMQHDTS